MFRGSTAITLDNKGRIAVPAKYREALMTLAEGQLICTIDLHYPCLLLYPIHEWNLIEEKLSLLSSINPAERRVKRLLLGHAHECQLDSAGRILIANTLRTHAQLKKEVMFIGQLNKFELWNSDAWYTQVEHDMQIDSTPTDCISERLEGLSL